MKVNATRNPRRNRDREDAYPNKEKHAGNDGWTGPRRNAFRRTGGGAQPKTRSMRRNPAFQPAPEDLSGITETIILVLMLLGFLVSATEGGVTPVSKSLLVAAIIFVCYLLIGQPDV